MGAEQGGGIDRVALLAHTDCGMARLTNRREAFIEGFSERGGWSPGAAAAHFDHYAARYQIGDARFGFVPASRSRS